MKKKADLWISIERNQGWFVFFITILLGFFFMLFNKNFLRISNIYAIILNSCILIILAAAEGVVILTGNIDVSVASTLALASFIGFDVFVRVPQLGAFGILIPLLIGGVCGLINGILIGNLKLSPIIVTLGTMSVFRGLAVIYANGRQINAHEIPKWVNASINGNIFGVSYLIIYTLVIILAIFMFA